MAVRCKSSDVQGNVTLGDGCVLHPTCRLLAADGATISIGAGCVLEELSVVEAAPGTRVVIGAGNLFEVQLALALGATGVGGMSALCPLTALYKSESNGLAGC
jgi:dynactin-6